MGEFKKRVNTTRDKDGYKQPISHRIILNWIEEAKQEFKEATSLQDYLILVEKWFGAKEENK